MAWPEGMGRVVLDAVDSTNDEARRLMAAGAPTPLWIMARRQTQGRGRRGRVWDGPLGNLAATCAIRPDMSPARAALLSFAACLSVAELFETFVPGADITLKWPNDALLNGRKAAGVLLESAGSGARMDWLAVGIGINLANHPEPEPGGWPPTSVLAEAGRTPDAEVALEVLAERFAHWSERFSGEGFLPLRAAWLARAARLGQKVMARLPRETVEGVFVDLDPDGALVLSTPSGVRRIQAADVFFG